MSETDEEFHLENWLFSAPKTLLNSLEIICLKKPILYLFIFALTTFPLSLLLLSLSLSSQPLVSRVVYLESLAQLSGTHFEGRGIWKESRHDALSLLRLKAIISLPCYALSLLAAITAVTATASFRHRKPVSFQTGVVAVKLTWKRPLATTLCSFILMFGYVHAVRTLETLLTGSDILRMMVSVIGPVSEVYLRAVLSLGLVVSVLEARSGFEAIRAGSDLMERRRFCGWVLSGLMTLVSRFIGSVDMDSGADILYGVVDWAETTAEMGVVEAMRWNMVNRLGLVGVLGLVILISYVVATDFYVDCRRWSAFESGDIETSIV